MGYPVRAVPSVATRVLAKMYRPIFLFCCSSINKPATCKSSFTAVAYRVWSALVSGHWRPLSARVSVNTVG